MCFMFYVKMEDSPKEEDNLKIEDNLKKKDEKICR